MYAQNGVNILKIRNVILKPERKKFLSIPSIIGATIVLGSVLKTILFSTSSLMY